MPDLIGPYDSEPGWWTQAEWYKVAHAWAPSGVLGVRQTALTGGGFAVTSSGLTVTVAIGTAWIRGGGYSPASATPLSVAANGHGSWSRRDRIVIRRDLDAQTTTLELLTGTAAASPLAPDLAADEDGIWEIPICSFLVPPSSGTTLSGFVDERAWVDPRTGQLSFQTTAARDANLPTPADGLEVWVGADFAFYTRVFGVWQPRARFKSGATTITTSASGYATVTHGAVWTPLGVLVTGRLATNAGLVFAVTDITSTTFTVYVANGINAPLASTAVPIFWTAFL